jgi:MFS transporter, AAHS family, 4-hydroxybenzoate transporter
MAGGYASTTEAALAGQRIGALQLRVAILCGLAQAFDGYDISAIGMAAPSLSHAWNVPPAAFATAFVMSNVGVMVGALASGPAGDRLGRKPVILTSLLFLGAFSFATAYAGSIPMLAFLRFMTGIGIGALMPSTVALASDYAPDRLRATVTMWVFAGNPLGGFLGGQLIAALLPIFGWQVIFHVGGALPLLLFPVLSLAMPESPRILLSRGRRTQAGLRIYAATGVDPAAAGSAVQHVDVARGNTVAALFADGYAFRTVLFWIMFFASLLSLYLIGFWLPTVLHLEGLSPADAVFASSLYSAGGGLSVLLLGPLATRLGTDRVLIACLAFGIVVIAGVALGQLPYLVLLVAIFVMGICVVGGQLGAVGREVSGSHTHHRRRLGTRHRPTWRHSRAWPRWFPAGPGLAAAAHPVMRLHHRGRGRAVRTAAATAGGAGGRRADHGVRFARLTAARGRTDADQATGRRAGLTHSRTCGHSS